MEFACHGIGMRTLGFKGVVVVCMYGGELMEGGGEAMGPRRCG